MDDKRIEGAQGEDHGRKEAQIQRVQTARGEHKPFAL
jgi:hypothetical protein